MRKWLLGFLGLGIIALLVYFLLEVFGGNWILRQTFTLGPVEIHYYGLTMAAAVASGFYLAVKRAKAYGLDNSQAENIVFWVAAGGFIGARLYHVASSYAYYWAHPADIIKVWNGGLSIYGAVFGGLITLLLCKRIFNFQFSIFKMLDWLTPSLLLGQIIGRFGNLFNYEAFGYPTNLPWKMFVPMQFRPGQYQSYNFFHPFFLYEALGCAVIFFLLTKVIKSEIGGRLFFSYLLLYNILRFALEFLRIDSTFIGQFRLNAIMSLLLAIIASIGIFYTNKHAEVP